MNNNKIHPCKTCVWFKSNFGIHDCIKPGFGKIEWDVVLGERFILPKCEDMRAEDGPCGPEGRLHHLTQKEVA